MNTKSQETETNAGGKPADAGETPAQPSNRVALLERENANLREQNKSLKAQLRERSFGDLPEEAEEAVREKIAAGLSREQAIAVVKQQAIHDAKLAEDAKKAAKK